MANPQAPRTGDEKRLRVFLDANILIRGITLPRFPCEVLRHAAKGDFIIDGSSSPRDSEEQHH
jgi:hypothetical protein